MSSTLKELKKMYFKRIEEINELERSKEELAKQICHKTYPYKVGQKVLVKAPHFNDFVPAYYTGSTVECIARKLYVIPILNKVKKDGSMSSVVLIHVCWWTVDEIKIKPYVEE